MIANSQALGEEPGMDIYGIYGRYCTCTHLFLDYLQELYFHDFSIEHSFQRNEELTLFEGL
jgi:hypothetical protein